MVEESHSGLVTTQHARSHTFHAQDTRNSEVATSDRQHQLNRIHPAEDQGQPHDAVYEQRHFPASQNYHQVTESNNNAQIVQQAQQPQRHQVWRSPQLRHPVSGSTLKATANSISSGTESYNLTDNLFVPPNAKGSTYPHDVDFPLPGKANRIAKLYPTPAEPPPFVSSYQAHLVRTIKQNGIQLDKEHSCALCGWDRDYAHPVTCANALCYKCGDILRKDAKWGGLQWCPTCKIVY